MCNCECNEETIYFEEARVGQLAPLFEMDAVMPDGQFGRVSLQENLDAGKWTILYFYPKDFTFVCPTEIKEMSEQQPLFDKLNTSVVAVSTDTTFVHQAWQNHPSLGKIAHPMAEDANHRVSEAYGVLIEDEGVALRGTFIINPEGVLMHATINHNDLGRSVDETVRVLQAAQAGGLAPCGWTPGDKLIGQ